MDREKLVEEINELEGKARELRKKVESLDHKENLNKISVYKNRFFIHEPSKNGGNERYFRLIYVYDIDEERCTVKSIEINYYVASEDWFEIQYYEHFNPIRYDDYEEWVETSKEEYDKHFLEVQRRINQAYNI